MSGNALVLHGGGPTSVLNSSLVGIVQESAAQPGIRRVYGARGGAAGLLSADLLDLSGYPATLWPAIAQTPGSALGSSRRHVTDADFERMLEVLRGQDIRYIFPTGGNGTMELALRLAGTCRTAGYEASVIGVPKTIDNDLFGTDHTPGYPSAARFFLHTLQCIGADNRALPGVTVVEVLGRDTGWLCAATLLAREQEDDAPHLVYFPERPLAFAQLAADVERVYRKLGRVVVAVCEGQLDETGKPFGADVRRTSRVPLALNLAHVLSQRLSKELNLSARSEKPGLLGRSCAALASPVDRDEARECGRAAVRYALSGETAMMVTIGRAEPYRAVYGKIAISETAGRSRLFPVEWIPSGAEASSPGFSAWLKPLIGSVQRFGRL